MALSTCRQAGGRAGRQAEAFGHIYPSAACKTRLTEKTHHPHTHCNPLQGGIIHTTWHARAPSEPGTNLSLCRGCCQLHWRLLLGVLLQAGGRSAVGKLVHAHRNGALQSRTAYSAGLCSRFSVWCVAAGWRRVGLLGLQRPLPRLHTCLSGDVEGCGPLGISCHHVGTSLKQRLHTVFVSASGRAVERCGACGAGAGSGGDDQHLHGALRRQTLRPPGVATAESAPQVHGQPPIAPYMI